MKPKKGEHFFLPPWFWRIKHNRRIKKREKKCWRDEKKRLSRIIDSGITLHPTFHDTLRKSYKSEIRRLKSMIRNHGNEHLLTLPGPFTYEPLQDVNNINERRKVFGSWKKTKKLGQLSDIPECYMDYGDI